MAINHFNEEKKGYFEALEDHRKAGKMTYTWAGKSRFIIDHTEVNPDFGGKGIGKQMVMSAVKYARENKVKIVPLCPFAKKVLAADEFKDVVV